MSEAELQAWDWGVLFAILSLDLSAPFLPDIGLAVDPSRGPPVDRP
jgi:hypothetical protein